MQHEKNIMGLFFKYLYLEFRIGFYPWIYRIEIDYLDSVQMKTEIIS